MVLEIIRRILYGIVIVIPIFIVVYLCSIFPIIIFIICIPLLLYAAGAMVDEELAVRAKRRYE